MGEFPNPRINDTLWDAQVAFMHLVVPRKKALEMMRLHMQIQQGVHHEGQQYEYDIPMYQYDDISETLRRERNGVRITGSLCQLSLRSIKFDHGLGLPFIGEYPTAIRGAMVDLMPADGSRHMAFILDEERSRQYYDQASPLKRRKLVARALSHIRLFPNLPANTHFAILSDIPGGYRIEEFAKV
jgi:hypothetical protein